jgi:membrane-bound metal-dependent hydrolase YbcI (DUF457 family)
MDPVSHVVLGRTIATAGGLLTKSGRAAGIATALGALSPDADVALMPVGWDIYLRVHEVGTHSIAGAIVTGLGSAAVVRLFARRTAFLTLAGCAIAGALSHLVADVAAGARLRPLWPAVDAVVSLPLVAMGDPWTLAIIVGGALAARVWGGGRGAAWSLLGVLAVFLALKGALLAMAVARADFATPPGWTLGHVAEAQWGTLTTWRVFDETAEGVRARLIDARRDAVIVFVQPRAPRSNLLDASAAMSTVRNFRSVHATPFAIQLEEDGRTAVLWSDARYCRHASRAAPPAQRRARQDRGLEAGDRRRIVTPGSILVECALWFGGVFDDRGRPLVEQMRVGSWVQRRETGFASVTTGAAQ